MALTILEHSRNLMNGLALKRTALPIFRSLDGHKALVAPPVDFLR